MTQLRIMKYHFVIHKSIIEIGKSINMHNYFMALNV